MSTCLIENSGVSDAFCYRLVLVDMNTETSYQICQDNEHVNKYSDEGMVHTLNGNLEGSALSCRLMYPRDIINIDGIIFISTGFSVLRLEGNSVTA